MLQSFQMICFLHSNKLRILKIFFIVLLFEFPKIIYMIQFSKVIPLAAKGFFFQGYFKRISCAAQGPFSQCRNEP